jgi:tetratricopeptide (TPR) repeat protein
MGFLLPRIVFIVSLLLLEPGYEQPSGIEGFLKTGDGSVVADATVIIFAGDSGFRKAVASRPDGSFSFSDLAEAEYDLWAHKEGFFPEHRMVVVRSGGPATVTVKLRPLPQGVVSIVAKNDQAMFDEATMMLQRSEAEQALAAFNNFLVRYPYMVKAYYNTGLCKVELALVLKQQRQWPKAEELERDAQEDFALVLERYPDFTGALTASASSHIRTFQTEEASKEYAKLVEIEPQNPELWYNYGETLVTTRQMDAAMAAFNKVLELEPDFADAHAKIAAIQYHAGEFEDAVRHLERYIELEPDSDMTAYAKEMLADCRKNLQEREQSER